MLKRLSLRARIAVVLGIVLALGAAPAWAYWQSQQSVPSSSFTLGRLDLRLNAQDGTVAVSGLSSVATMYPGDSVAGIVTVTNAGTVPLSYWATISGSNADGKGMADNLDVAVARGGTVVGTAPKQTCSGGTKPAGVPAKASTATSPPITLAYGSAAAAREVLQPNTSEQLCVQLTLDVATPGSVQGATTTVTITANGEQVAQP
jgi:predicted ribosomally synthesized peptide with SipW-like signal peptide